MALGLDTRGHLLVIVARSRRLRRCGEGCTSSCGGYLSEIGPFGAVGPARSRGLRRPRQVVSTDGSPTSMDRTGVRRRAAKPDPLLVRQVRYIPHRDHDPGDGVELVD